MKIDWKCFERIPVWVFLAFLHICSRSIPRSLWWEMLCFFFWKQQLYNFVHIFYRRLNYMKVGNILLYMLRVWWIRKSTQRTVSSLEDAREIWLNFRRGVIFFPDQWINSFSQSFISVNYENLPGMKWFLFYSYGLFLQIVEKFKLYFSITINFLDFLDIFRNFIWSTGSI